MARRFVPFCAVAAADVLNLGITRKVEILEGINVYSENGECVGKSRLAGSMAVGACIGGRIAAAAPILIIPPLVMHKYGKKFHTVNFLINVGSLCYLLFRLEHSNLFQKRPWLRTPTLMGMIGVSIQVFVPLFFGMFKQRADIGIELLEPHFRNLVTKSGEPIYRVSYNKGI